MKNYPITNILLHKIIYLIKNYHYYNLFVKLSVYLKITLILLNK